MKKVVQGVIVISTMIVSAIIFPRQVYGQAGGTIAYGETVEGQLNGENSHFWQFEGTAEVEIIISMTSEGINPALTLLDPTGNIAATDSGDDNPDEVLEISLTSDGIYTIIVANTVTEASGRYSLTLSLADESEIVFQVEAVLPVGERTTHTFIGNENDRLVIYLSSVEFDPILSIFDPAGSRLARDDDNGGHYNALIAIVLSSDGDFTLEVDSYTGEEGGTYSLVVSKGSQTIDLDSPVTGEFEYDSVVYAFMTDDPTSVDIAVNSEDFDPVVAVVDQNGTVVDGDDDSGGDLNALVSVSLEGEQTYFFIVRAFEENGTGSYELAVTSDTDTLGSPNDTVGTIDYGQTIVDRVDGTSPIYEFEGGAGDAIRISLSSDDFDTIVELLDPNGSRLDINDDIADGNLNSEIETTLLVDGTYRIVVRAFDPPAVGEFTLTLTNDQESD